MPDLPADPVELRLLIEPSDDRVKVRVNGTDRGTYVYAPKVPQNRAPYADCVPWGTAGAEFSRLSIRVADAAP